MLALRYALPIVPRLRVHTPEKISSRTLSGKMLYSIISMYVGLESSTFKNYSSPIPSLYSTISSGSGNFLPYTRFKPHISATPPESSFRCKCPACAMKFSHTNLSAALQYTERYISNKNKNNAKHSKVWIFWMAFIKQLSK